MSKRVLKGVPPLSFASGERFTPVGSLKAVADFLGKEVTYSWLMGVSGAAFRTCWSDRWSQEMTYAAPEDLLSNAAAAIHLGCESQLNGKSQEVWASIGKSIDSSMPLLTCGLAGAPEFGVVYGYQDEPQALFVRSYFREEEEGVPFQSWVGWNYSGHGRYPLVLLEKGESGEEELPLASLRRALRFSRGEGPMTTRAQERELHLGLEAYDAWAEGLERVEGDLEGMAFNMALNLNALLDARRTAGEYLEILAAMRESWRKPLMRACDHYRHQVATLAQARNILYFPPDLPEEAARKAGTALGQGRLRRDYARLIRDAKEEELLSLEWIEQAVEG